MARRVVIDAIASVIDVAYSACRDVQLGLNAAVKCNAGMLATKVLGDSATPSYAPSGCAEGTAHNWARSGTEA